MVMGRLALLLVALAACVATSAACAPRHAAVKDVGIRPCAADAESDLLTPTALQCWFRAEHARWRILSHESHYNALVVDISAIDPRDAGEIARRFVSGH